AARVVVSDRHERRLAEAAERLGVPGVLCDVTDQAQVEHLFAAAVAHLGGGLDVLVNNAGLGGTANVVDMPDEQWGTVLDGTLTSPRSPRRSSWPSCRPGRRSAGRPSRGRSPT